MRFKMRDLMPTLWQYRGLIKYFFCLYVFLGTFLFADIVIR